MAQGKGAFLAAFRECGIVKAACEQAGVSRSSVYRWQELDDAFAAAYREAEIEATETMEAEAYRRAMKGTSKPVFHQGVQCGVIQDYSDVLLIFMLKARAPEKYRENPRGDQIGGAPPVKAYPESEWERLP